jgi:Skp family chaperone for outer membrane proteins
MRFQFVVYSFDRALLRIAMLARLFFIALLTAVFAVSAFSQTSRPPVPDMMSADKSSPDSKNVFESAPGEEMRARRLMKIAEKEHQENVERAREVARLSSELKNSSAKTALGSDDKKKLEKLEKLTRRVRSQAGGSDSEVTLERIPVDLESAISRLADASEEMRKEVEKTPRQVLSTCVIDRANQILEILQYARRFIQ